MERYGCLHARDQNYFFGLVCVGDCGVRASEIEEYLLWLQNQPLRLVVPYVVM